MILLESNKYLTIYIAHYSIVIRFHNSNPFKNTRRSKKKKSKDYSPFNLWQLYIVFNSIYARNLFKSPPIVLHIILRSKIKSKL